MGKKQEKTKQILVNRDVSTYLNIYFLIFFQLELKQCLDNVTNDVSKSFIQEKKELQDKTLPRTGGYNSSPHIYNRVG